MSDIVFYSRWHVRLLCSVQCLGSLVFGYYLVVINPYNDALQIEFKWSESQESFYIGLLTSTLYMAAVIGCAIQLLLLNQYKNRFIMISTDAVSIVAMVIQLAVPDASYIQIILTRAIQGVCVGINSSIISVQIQQISPREMLNEIGTYTQLSISLGSLIFWCIYSMNQKQNYIFALSYPIIFLLIRSLVLIFLLPYDSQSECSERGDTEGIRKLQKFLRMKDELVTTLQRDSSYSSSSGPSTYQEKHEELHKEGKHLSINNRQIQSDIVNHSPTRDTLRMVSTAHLSVPEVKQENNKRQLIYGIVLCMASQFCGINMVMSYSSKIFKSNALTLNIIMMVVQILACLTSSLISRRFGLKLMLLGGQVTLFANLILLGILQLLDLKNVASVFVILFVFFFGLTLGSSTWAAIPLLLAKKQVAVATSLRWIFNAAVAWASPTIILQLGLYGAFFLYALLLGLCFVYCLLLHKDADRIAFYTKAETETQEDQLAEEPYFYIDNIISQQKIEEEQEIHDFNKKNNIN